MWPFDLLSLFLPTAQVPLLLLVVHGRVHFGLQQVNLLLVCENFVLVLSHLDQLTLHLAQGAAKAPKHAAAPAMGAQTSAHCH